VPLKGELKERKKKKIELKEKIRLQETVKRHEDTKTGVENYLPTTTATGRERKQRGDRPKPQSGPTSYPWSGRQGRPVATPGTLPGGRS